MKIFLLAGSKVGCTDALMYFLKKYSHCGAYRCEIVKDQKSSQTKTTGERLPQQQPHMLEDTKGAYQVTKKNQASFSTVSLPQKMAPFKSPSGWEGLRISHADPRSSVEKLTYKSFAQLYWLQQTLVKNGNFCTTNPRICVQDGAP